MSDETQNTETPMDFNTFVMSLSASALLHLGALTDPQNAGAATAGDDKVAVNLPLAKHTIDCLAMLEEKTKGNLTGEEERLLSEILTDLRMRFVSASKSTS